MSYSTVLGITPGQRPEQLMELRNAHGWSASIWSRLLGREWWRDEVGLHRLWATIEEQPAWQQVPNVLTFDTGVIPRFACEWAAEQLDEFNDRLPAPEGHVNHVPAVADLLRAGIGTPFVGVWGTSVTENPFDPWDEAADEPGSGIPLGEMYVLERHRPQVLAEMV